MRTINQDLAGLAFLAVTVLLIAVLVFWFQAIYNLHLASSFYPADYLHPLCGILPSNTCF